MSKAKSSGCVGDDKHGDTDRRKVVDPDTRKVIGTISTPRGVSAS